MSTENKPLTDEKWYTRPIFSVADINRSLCYYCDSLDFEQTWKHDEHGKTSVTQVNKGDFELILTANLDNAGKSRVYIALEPAEQKVFQENLSTRQIPSERIHWGYPLIRLRDPDGNELLFSMEDHC